jgi:RNA polymerase sigma-70 factor (ECF subfamily)
VISVLSQERVAPAADDEAALVAGAQRGSPDAVEALVRAHWQRAHRTAFLIVHDAAAAEDICQEAMLATVRRIHRFDRRRPLAPWLHRIVVNRSLDWLRAHQRRAEVAADAVADAPAREDEGLPHDLLGALAALDPSDRAVVVLRHLLDYDSGEIGRALGMPPATVRTRLRRALDRLRTVLEEEGGR